MSFMLVYQIKCERQLWVWGMNSVLQRFLWGEVRKCFSTLNQVKWRDLILVRIWGGHESVMNPLQILENM